MTPVSNKNNNSDGFSKVAIVTNGSAIAELDKELRRFETIRS